MTGGSLDEPFVKDLTATPSLNALPIFSDELVTPTRFTKLLSADTSPSEVNLDLCEDAYESIKYLNYTHHLNYLTNLSSLSTYLSPMSYTQVLNTFRSNYDELVFNVDSVVDLLGTQNNTNTNLDYHLRLSNPLKLRSTTKNAMVTYSAIQKVFRSRFDEGRSNAKLLDISNSFVSYPSLSERRTPYESLLGKNKETFFKINNYNQLMVTNLNALSSVWTSLNTYFADIPFLISTQSDPSRYLWFD